MGWLPPIDDDARGGPERPAATPAPSPVAPAAPLWAAAPSHAAAPTNAKATGALVLGILGIILLPVVLSVPALVLGYKAKAEIDRARGGQGGRSSAIAGIVLGWVGILLGLVIIGFIVLGLALAGGEVDLEQEPLPSEPIELVAPQPA